MSAIIVFNSGATPQNVLQYIPSNADPAAYNGRQDVLIDPSILAVAGIPQIYWKVSGSVLAPMTSPEQAAVDAAIAAGALSSERSGAISALVSTDAQGAVLRAIAAVMVDEINIVRTALSLSSRTLTQFKTAIQSKVNSGAVDS